MLERSQAQVESESIMQHVNTGSPLERIAIDIVGPLPRTDNGNEYSMVVTDYFTMQYQITQRRQWLISY